MCAENSYWLNILQALQHKSILPRYLMCTKLAQVLIVLDESIWLTSAFCLKNTHFWLSTFLATHHCKHEGRGNTMICSLRECYNSTICTSNTADIHDLLKAKMPWALALLDINYYLRLNILRLLSYFSF